VHVSGVRSHLWMSTLASAAGPRFRALGSRAGLCRYGTDPQEAALRAGGRPGSPGWGEDPHDSWTEVGAADDFRRVATEPGDYRRFYEGVADSLRTGAPPPVPIADAIAGLEVIEAARQSAAERRVVLLHPTA
jgi:scyllo-inositol 2-dehydrogenase (NADP+)